MVKNDSFTVGDYIIDSDQIFVITSISQGRLHYRTLKTQEQPVTGSIPVENAIPSGLRQLVSPDIIKTFFKNLSIVTPGSEQIDPRSYKEFLYLNQPLKAIPLLQQLWLSKSKTNNDFTFNNRLTFDNIINHISQEFSLVSNKKIDFFRNKIISYISKI